MIKTVSISITGKVQGVWFRKYTQEKAQQLTVTGYVKNLYDSSVFIVATGTEIQLQELINWCWHGSPKSKVEHVHVHELELQLFAGFVIE